MLTNAAAIGLLNCIAGRSCYYVMHTGKIYLGLHCGDSAPTYAGGNFSEPTVDDYARVAVVIGTSSSSTNVTTSGVQHFSSPFYDSSDAMWKVSNSQIIQFNETSHAWDGEVTHFGLFSTSNGATPFFVGELSSAISVVGTSDAGKVVLFRSGELVIQVSGASA